MSWTLCSSYAAITKAGDGANATIKTNAASLAIMSDMAESTINLLTRYDWVANYRSVGTNFQGVLADAASDLVAIKIINYDMSGYTSRTEAQTMLDVLSDNFQRIISVLKEEEYKEVMV